MPGIQVIVAKGSGPTGATLIKLLNDNGVQAGDNIQNPDAYVSYGVRSGSTKPILNRNAGGNKREQILNLSKGGVATPRIYVNNGRYLEVKLPVLCRKASHRGGTDIAMTFTGQEMMERFGREGFDYATEFIPVLEEFRVWIYRRQHLGSYIKVLKYPEKYRRIGRNYANGFVFELLPSERVPRGAVDLAARAIDVLGLDFGAVDIIQSRDNKEFYVLEVNTAPGVEGEGRQVIQSLAKKIVRWKELGYPKRKGEKRAD